MYYLAITLILHFMHDLIIFKIPFQKLKLEWKKNILEKLFISVLITVYANLDFIFLSAIFESLFLGKPFHLFSQGWISLILFILMLTCFTHSIIGLNWYYESYKARMAELNKPLGT
jgi:hypothetical protein